SCLLGSSDFGLSVSYAHHWHLVHDADAEAFERDDLAGVVCQQTDGAEAAVREDLGADAGFVLQAALAGVGRIFIILSRMRDHPLSAGAGGFETVTEAGLVEVDEDAAAFRGDALEGALDHLVALAAGGEENVTEQAVGVHAD